MKHLERFFPQALGAFLRQQHRPTIHVNNSNASLRLADHAIGPRTLFELTLRNQIHMLKIRIRTTTNLIALKTRH